MHHKCVQVRKGGGGGQKIIFVIFFADVSFAKGMQLKKRLLFFTIKQHLVREIPTGGGVFYDCLLTRPAAPIKGRWCGKCTAKPKGMCTGVGLP